MKELIQAATDSTRQLDRLESRFRIAATRKGYFLLGAYAIGSALLLLSVMWSGQTALLVRVVLITLLVSLYFVPVHFFVRGRLRVDAQKVRRLGKERARHMKRAAQVGMATNGALRRKLEDHT